MKQMLRIGLVLLFVYSCFPLILRTQSSFQFSNIEYITSDEGLSQNEITCILQDKTGFLWIGTRGGLNRYDGHQFKIFQNEIGNVNSLINNSVESLLEDRNGRIWIGTKSNGMSCYDPEYDQFEHFQAIPNDSNSLSGNRIITLAESSNGEIWTGTWKNGLTIFNPVTSTFRQLLGQEKINGIKQTIDGKMWVTTPVALYFFTSDGRQLRRYAAPLPKFQLIDILVDRNSGHLYLGTWDSGLWEFDPIKETFKHFPFQSVLQGKVKSNNVYRLYQDNQGHIWMGSWNGGLRLFHSETGTFSHFDLVSGNGNYGHQLYQDVLSIFQDRSGVFWFGTNGGGICKVDERISQFDLMHKNAVLPGFSSEPIWSILKDQNDILWVGVKGSEAVYYSQDGVTFSSLTLPKTTLNDISEKKLGARTMYQIRNGTIWAADNFGLFKIELINGKHEISSRRIKVEAVDDTVSLTQVAALCETEDGTFWIGTQQRGLIKSIGPGDPETGTFKIYSPKELESGLKSNRISAMLEDKTGQFWVGTYNGLHLYRHASDDFLHFSKKQGDIQSLSSDIIICLHEDQNGNLWIGTPNGLNLAIPGLNQSLTFKCFQEKDGLPNNYIHAILEDDDGNLWISTNKGISKYNPVENLFYNYDVNDGLQSNSFMEGIALRDKNGLFFFGGINGLNVFHPDSILPNTVPPPVILTGLKVFNEEVQAGYSLHNRIILEKALPYCKSIILTHRENVFTIDYTTINFQATSGTSYMYKMEGLENDWNYAGTQKSITYSNLNSGDYTFRVKAVNNRETGNEHDASLQIEVLPPFWATSVAFVLYTLIFTGLLLLYRYFINQQSTLKNNLELSRMERKKEMELAEMKTRFFTNVAHEFRTPLTLISGPVEAMMNTENLIDKQKYYLSTVHQQTRRLLGLVNQLLDFRKAESGHLKLKVANGDFVEFTKEIFLSFEEVAESKNILYQFNVSQREMPMYFDRDNMEIVLCNLLSNAFKYTSGNKIVSLSLKQYAYHEEKPQFPKGYCELVVEDTGQGMSPDILDRIFDRFYQIVNTNSAKLIGTGIGLALVKNIVELHTGKVLAQSKIGQGSKFTVQLPIGKSHFTKEQLIPEYRGAEHESHYQAKFIKHRIKSSVLLPDHISNKNNHSQLLIVEDNLEIRSFLVEIFEKDYVILEASNGREGLEILSDHVPNLIISDLMMPEMDGLTFCRQVRKMEKTTHIPVILLTARTATVFQVEGFQSGADAYITKPFQPAIIRAQVKGLLTSRQRMRESFAKKITLQPTDIEITSHEEEFINKMIQQVEENLDNDDLNRNFLAQSMAMSPSSLYRKLKSLTGFTTNAFIRSIRLKRGAQLMRDTQLNISEIAYLVGFSDLKYFRRCFRDQFDMNPSEYIENQDLLGNDSSE